MNTATKTVTMMDLRRNIGAILDEMIYQHKDIIIKRRDKIIGVIKPQIEEQTTNQTEETRHQKIDRLFGCMSYLSNKEAEEWIHGYDDVEKEYDNRMEKLWNGKSSDL